MSYLAIVPRWVADEPHAPFRIGTNAICATTLEDVKRHLYFKIVHVHMHVRMDLFEILLKEIFPNMPNLEKLFLLYSGLTFDRHALCAKLLRTNTKMIAFSIREDGDFEEIPVIEALYIRTLRHIHPLMRMQTLCLRTNKNDLPRLLEYAKRDAPSMLEYCYEALKEK